MNNHQQELLMRCIGLVHTRERYRYEAPRQGIFADNEGYIELLPNNNFEAALSDLSNFERIWVIFKFHLNECWNPKVAPPVIMPKGKKVGVFASRSPHRPNPVGISAVELIKIDKLKLYIRNFDMLDGTPVFDLKPYIPKADSFPNAKAGWVEETALAEWQLSYIGNFTQKAAFIAGHSGLDLANFCRTQLSIEPLDCNRKRIHCNGLNKYSIGCRTWRIHFEVLPELKQIIISDVMSNYSISDLAPSEIDRYGDKDLHREFLRKFGLY